MIYYSNKCWFQRHHSFGMPVAKQSERCVSVCVCAHTHAHTHIYSKYHLHSFPFSLRTDTLICSEICKQHISVCIIQNVPLYHCLCVRLYSAAELKLKDCVCCSFSDKELLSNSRWLLISKYTTETTYEIPYDSPFRTNVTSLTNVTLNSLTCSSSHS